MRLTNQQYIALSNIFHKRFDKFSNGLQMRTASFPAVVRIVEEFLRYLLAKKAAPAWDGVDPKQFLDEVRGRTIGLEWKTGAPDMSGTYLLVTRIGKTVELYDEYDPDHEYWDIDEVLWHIGPIPPVPQNDEQ